MESNTNQLRKDSSNHQEEAIITDEKEFYEILLLYGWYWLFWFVLV